MDSVPSESEIMQRRILDSSTARGSKSSSTMTAVRKLSVEMRRFWYAIRSAADPGIGSNSVAGGFVRNLSRRLPGKRN